MNNTVEITVKKKQPDKNKVSISSEKREKSALAKLYGLLKGQVFYDSDDIFFQYRLTQ